MNSKQPMGASTCAQNAPHRFEVERVVAGGVPVSMHKTAHRRSFPVHSTASAGDAGRAVSARVASGSPAASMVRRRRRAVPLCERGRGVNMCVRHTGTCKAPSPARSYTRSPWRGGQHAQGAGGPLARYDSRPTGGAVDLGAAPLLIDAPWRPWWGHLASSKCSGLGGGVSNAPPTSPEALRRSQSDACAGSD